ncbi:unnamed protein product [Cladocopium goreaui]|uniref:Uncharacterized protein n=1 Tax=Cladocopium goreaui TaxID=2562237 RepID=A0A9P1G3M7_9DINO|nr:unnamed protein product [Cladocopium goreaui]
MLEIARRLTINDVFYERLSYAAEGRTISAKKQAEMERVLLNCSRPEIDSVKFQPETWLKSFRIFCIFFAYMGL